MALDWVRSYLSNRLQFVQFNGQCSSPQTICCGVPQGSILGPLFFLLYINDLNNVSTLVELILFADDTNLFTSHKDPVYLTASLNSELNKSSTWFKANKLSLNLKKTNYMLFKPRQKRYHFPMQISGLLIFRGKKSKISRDFQGQIRGKISRFCEIFAGKNSKFAEKSADLVGEGSKFAEKSANFAGF